jgi:hypothetical protein
MRKMIALFISTAFLLGTAGLAVAQTPTPAPAQEKKPATKAMSMEQKKAACLEKATAPSFRTSRKGWRHCKCCSRTDDGYSDGHGSTCGC